MANAQSAPAHNEARRLIYKYCNAAIGMPTIAPRAASKRWVAATHYYGRKHGSEAAARVMPEVADIFHNVAANPATCGGLYDALDQQCAAGWVRGLRRLSN